MLVLSRKKDEQIVIGDSIFVTLVDVRRGQVRLGIQAPKDVPVHRSEVFEALRDARSRHERRGAIGQTLSPRSE
jgi:carbon storage regulator